MKILVLVYIILYFLYIILGPHFESRLINNDKLKITRNADDLRRRSMFLSYITLLYNAYYFYNPSLESFYNALIINVVSIVGFIIKWDHLKYSDPYYFSGIITHILFFIPILLSPFYLNLSNILTLGIQSKFSVLFSLYYVLMMHTIYKK